MTKDSAFQLARHLDNHEGSTRHDDVLILADAAERLQLFRVGNANAVGRDLVPQSTVGGCRWHQANSSAPAGVNFR